jgi:hypothetical protein
MLPRVVFVGAISTLAVFLWVSTSAADPANWSGFSVSVGGGASKTNANLNVDASTTDHLFFPGALTMGQALANREPAMINGLVLARSRQGTIRGLGTLSSAPLPILTFTPTTQTRRLRTTSAVV